MPRYEVQPRIGEFLGLLPLRPGQLCCCCSVFIAMLLFSNKCRPLKLSMGSLSSHPQPEPWWGSLKPVQEDQGNGRGGGGVVSVSPGAGGRWASPSTAGWLSWRAMGAGLGAGWPGGCPGWKEPVPRCSMAGWRVFQAQAVAAAVGSGSQGCCGMQVGCQGSRGSCWCGIRLTKLRRGACGERRLLRPGRGCGAGWV